MCIHSIHSIGSTIMSSNNMFGPVPAVAHAPANAPGTGVDKPTAGTEWAIIREVTRKEDGKKTIVHFKSQALCDAWFANIIDQTLGVGLDMPGAALPALLFYFETLEAKTAWMKANLERK